MRYKTSNFISHSLRWNDRHFPSYLLVRMEVQSKLGVVFLDYHSCGSLYSLGSDTLKSYNSECELKTYILYENIVKSSIYHCEMIFGI